jgi:hypothetical protein
MNLMDARMIPVVGRSPHLDHRGSSHPIEEELLENDTLQRSIVDCLLPGKITIAEAVAFVEPAFGKLLPTSPQDSEPHPRIKTDLRIAVRPGIDRDNHANPESGIERDPKMIGMPVVTRRFNSSLEIIANDTHKRRGDLLKDPKPPAALHPSGGIDGDYPPSPVSKEKGL